MTFRQAKREIEALGWSIVATTTFVDGYSFDAKSPDNTKLARSDKHGTTEAAMNALYRVVLSKT